MSLEGVRPAEEGDVARCAELLEEARRASEHTRGGAALWGSTSPGERAIRSRLADPSCTVLVGLFTGEIVGMAAGHKPPGPTGDTGSAAVIDCCYVEEAARGVGVGTALVEVLVDQFTQWGCTGVDAVALPGDRATKQLYEHAGFKARLLTLHRRLG